LVVTCISMEIPINIDHVSVDPFYKYFAITLFYPSWACAMYSIWRYHTIYFTAHIRRIYVYTITRKLPERTYYNIINIYIIYIRGTLARRYTRSKYGEYFLNYAKLYIIMLIITLCACGWRSVSVCTIRDIVNRIRIYIYMRACLIYDHCTHK